MKCYYIKQHRWTLKNLPVKNSAFKDHILYDSIHYKYLDQAYLGGFPGGASSKEPACHCRRPKRSGFDPRVWEILWRRKWQPTPVLLPAECHGQRSLQSIEICKESGRTEATQHTGISPRVLDQWMFMVWRGWEKVIVWAVNRE